MSAHTKGPWRLYRRHTGSFDVAPNVAWLGASSIHKPGENEANARLIASAPDLLEALGEMLEAWEGHFGEGACDCMPEPQNAGHVCQCCKARAAIAKAKGEQS